MAGVFRIVFSGGILPGFSLDLVRRHVRERLKATPEQLVRMFSGRPLVLKKDLDEPSALGYLHKLQELGLDVTLEAAGSSRSLSPAPSLDPAQPPVIKPENDPETASSLQQPAAEASVAPPSRRTENWESETGFVDFARTHLNLARAEALLNGSSVDEAPVMISSPALPLSAPPLQAELAPTATKQTAPLPSTQPAKLTLSGSIDCPQCGHRHAIQGTVSLEAHSI